MTDVSNCKNINTNTESWIVMGAHNNNEETYIVIAFIKATDPVQSDTPYQSNGVYWYYRGMQKISFSDRQDILESNSLSDWSEDTTVDYSGRLSWKLVQNGYNRNSYAYAISRMTSQSKTNWAKPCISCNQNNYVESNIPGYGPDYLVGRKIGTGTAGVFWTTGSSHLDTVFSVTGFLSMGKDDVENSGTIKPAFLFAHS